MYPKQELIPLRAAARLAPSSRTGASVIHVSTVYAWARKGVRGIRLETVLVGGTRFTSEVALWRFIDQLNEGAHAFVVVPKQDRKRATKTPGAGLVPDA